MALRSDVAARVKQQVEFYFSDSNLPRDPFLCGKVEEDPEGFVDLAIICSFTRMAQALGTQPKGPVSPHAVAQVAEALRGSETLVVTEDGRRVRRTVPMESPEVVARQVDERSVYAAPFPYTATLDDLTAFFAARAPVNCVRQRRHLTSKDFKGSCFVEFASVDAATQVLGMALEYEGAPLTLQRKQDFIAKKAAEREEKEAAARAQAANGTSTSAAAVEADAPMEDVPAEAVPAEAAATRDACVNGAAPGIGAAPAAAADTNGTPAAAAAPPAEAAAEEAGKATAAAVAAEPPAAQPPALQQAPDEALSFVPACVVHFQFEADEAAEDVGYPEVKEGLGGREQGVFYVEYQKGDKQGLVRCKDAAAATALLDRDCGTATIGGQAAKLRLLEGEEELAFYRRMAEAKRAKEERYTGGFAGRKRDRDWGGRGGRGGCGRGGRSGGRGGRGGRGRGGNKRGRY